MYLNIVEFLFGHLMWLVGILVPQPGIIPRFMAVKALSLNHWTTREFPHMLEFLFKQICSFCYIVVYRDDKAFIQMSIKRKIWYSFCIIIF